MAEGRLRVSRAGGEATLTMTLPTPCDGLAAVRTVARRAGRMRAGTLTATGTPGRGCLMTGEVDDLGPGRWFVYAELESVDGRRLEAWLPATEGTESGGTRPLYAPPARSVPASRPAVATALLLVVTGLVVASLRLARRASQVAVRAALPRLLA